MASKAAVSGSVTTVVRVMFVTAGVSFLFFLFGSAAAVFGSDDVSLPSGLFLGAGLLFSGLFLLMSLWLLAELADGLGRMGGSRGRQIQTPAIRACDDPILQLDDSLRVVALNPAAERRFKLPLAAANGMPVTFVLDRDRNGPPPKPQPPAAPQAPAADGTQTSVKRLAQRAGARLSHLVQPLLGFTEIALESVEPGHPVRADLAEIGRASARVVLLARALELFGGPGREPVLEPVDLNDFLASLEPDLRFVLQPATSLQILPAETAVVSLADPDLTRLAALLIACNAEDAMPPGSTITISATREGLLVADSGAGLPRDVRAAMFRPLISTKDSERGVGLGMHAARAAMRLQHGDLVLTQSGESGSVLTLSLPRHAPAEKPPAGKVALGLSLSTP